MITKEGDAGQALQRIRDERLYRESHETFEAYCKERWGFRRNYANKQIKAAETASTIVLKKLPPPPSEAVARELTKANDAEAVWSGTDVPVNG